MSMKHSQSSKSSFNENRWISLIKRTLEEKLDGDNDENDENNNDDDTPVSIFNVPKILLASDPESYTPQEVAIGPYHYLRPELYEMERYKLAAAKRAQNSRPTHRFQDHIVRRLTKHDQRVRACYHKYLDLSEETLAWMMAIDASFLLEFLRVYALGQGKSVLLADTSNNSTNSKILARFSSRLSRFPAHNVILRDLVMLENQIPLFVLKKMLEFQVETLEAADETLSVMLLGFCEEVSPFKTMVLGDTTMLGFRVSDCSHLLDFLYQILTPEMEGSGGEETVVEVNVAGDEEKNGTFDPNSLLGNLSNKSSSAVKQLFQTIWKIVSNIHKGPIILFLKKAILSRPMKLFLKLPWTILSNLPVLKLLKGPIEMYFSQEKDDEKSDGGGENSPLNINKPPLVEEIAIPSVTDLIESGILFCPTNGNISTVAFDPKTFSFYLPAVSLDVNTEAILRNLVAYEASSSSGPLVFTRYTELMNGIIDTEDDVRLLRERGIILNRLKSDGEAAELFNGLSKSIKLTKVPFLDKAIEEVNKYHEGRWKVKFGKFMKRYVFGSWQFLTLLAAILMLLFTGLQAFCSVYTCSRLFHDVSNSQTA